MLLPPLPLFQSLPNPQIHVSFQSLPKIDLPKFSGKFSDWENFRDVFRSIVHRREDLSLIMKLYYLHTHLTGEALEKIKSLLKSLNRAASLGSDLIVHFTLNRLNLNTSKEWERHLGNIVVPPTMEQLQAFLQVKPSL